MANPKAASSITESPWYWAYLFCTAGLVALVLMNSKYSARQSQIERKYQGRQRAAQQVSGEEPRTTMSSPDDTAIRLDALYVILAFVLAVAWFQLLRRHFRLRRSFAREETE